MIKKKGSNWDTVDKQHLGRKAVSIGVNSKRPPLYLLSIAEASGQNCVVKRLSLQLKKFSILFLYSLKNLTNGTKTTIKAILAAFYSWYKLVCKHFKRNPSI